MYNKIDKNFDICIELDNIIDDIDLLTNLISQEKITFTKNDFLSCIEGRLNSIDENLYFKCDNNNNINNHKLYYKDLILNISLLDTIENKQDLINIINADNENNSINQNTLNEFIELLENSDIQYYIQLLFNIHFKNIECVNFINDTDIDFNAFNNEKDNINIKFDEELEKLNACLSSLEVEKKLKYIELFNNMLNMIE